MVKKRREGGGVFRGGYNGAAGAREAARFLAEIRYSLPGNFFRPLLPSLVPENDWSHLASVMRFLPGSLARALARSEANNLKAASRAGPSGISRERDRKSSRSRKLRGNWRGKSTNWDKSGEASLARQTFFGHPAGHTLSRNLPAP